MEPIPSFAACIHVSASSVFHITSDRQESANDRTIAGCVEFSAPGGSAIVCDPQSFVCPGFHMIAAMTRLRLDYIVVLVGDHMKNSL